MASPRSYIKKAIILLVCTALLTTSGLWVAYAQKNKSVRLKKTSALSRLLDKNKKRNGSGAIQPLRSPKKGNGLFGTTEFKGPLTALPRWTRVLKEVQKHGGTLSAALAAGDKAPLQAWTTFKQTLVGLPSKKKLSKVNAFFNKWPYRLDMEIYGVEDYWATPMEFVKQSGDCEDYSIIKYYALKELEFDAQTLRIVAVQDRIRGIGHAVLVVRIDEEALVLDNQTNLLLQDDKYTHYLPQYSVNEKNSWTHFRTQ